MPNGYAVVVGNVIEASYGAEVTREIWALRLGQRIRFIPHQQDV